MKKIAIIGRPNVGKSTLFNRLAGKRQAIVDDQPGVTRDRKHGEGSIGPLHFGIIDTPGLETIDESSLEGRMFKQSMAALEEADVCLMVIDAIDGVTPRDEYFAEMLRRSKRPIIVVANKAEGKKSYAGVLEGYALGFGEPVAISAEHGEGMLDLYDRLAPIIAPESKNKKDEAPARVSSKRAMKLAALEAQEAQRARTEDEDEDEDEDDTRPINIAIVGRPNVGKSTLMNCLLGEDRVLTGPEAGITRDSILVPIQYHGRTLNLVDTAGMRKKARVQERLERMSVSDTTHSLKYAQVVVLVVDATQPLDKQDNIIASLVEREGRACVIALNKWDTVSDKDAFLDTIRKRLLDVMPQMKGISLIPISAMHGRNTDKLLQACLATYKNWNKRISTGALNRWLEEVLSRHTPPLLNGRRFKIRYMTQAKTRPPTFILFTNQAEGPESYLRYLSNTLREQFDMPGVPLRILLKTGKNPYADKD